MIKFQVTTSSDGHAVETNGLADTGYPEFRVRVNNPSLLFEAENFLHFVVDYLSQTGKKIVSGETLAYGYWLTKFLVGKDGTLEVWEYTPDATRFVEGATLTLSYSRDQHTICAKYRAQFSPPRPDQKVAISEGVYEGDPVEGVRYPSPEHMSGWWLTTDRYDGNIQSLKVVHLYHVTSMRPALAQYLALPYGFRFSVAPQQEVVRFDQKVVEKKS